MPFGDFSDQKRAQGASCHPGPPQSWTLDPGGAIRHDRQCLDIFDGVPLDGQAVQTYECHGGMNQRFSFEGLRLEFGGKCIGAHGDFPVAENTLLELQTCLPQTDANISKQQFYAEGELGILGECLDASSGTTVGIAPCNGSAAQAAASIS